jgi:hypothetical protein
MKGSSFYAFCLGIKYKEIVIILVDGNHFIFYIIKS